MCPLTAAGAHYIANKHSDADASMRTHIHAHASGWHMRAPVHATTPAKCHPCSTLGRTRPPIRQATLAHTLDTNDRSMEPCEGQPRPSVPHVSLSRLLAQQRRRHRQLGLAAVECAKRLLPHVHNINVMEWGWRIPNSDWARLLDCTPAPSTEHTTRSGAYPTSKPASERPPQPRCAAAAAAARVCTQRCSFHGLTCAVADGAVPLASSGCTATPERGHRRCGVLPSPMQRSLPQGLHLPEKSVAAALLRTKRSRMVTASTARRAGERSKG
eukprot:365123-Chlamydomonas_euryale.AAC.40